MNRLIRAVFETLEYPLFSSADLQNIEPEDNIRFALVKRALHDGDLIQLKRGLYTLSGSLRKKNLAPGLIANRLYFPSYVSFEYALSFHGWIPERVATITCATPKNAASFDNPLGRFSYTRIPQVMFFCGVETSSADGESFLLARPLKALADYVYARKLDWTNRRPLLESLRIEDEELESLTSEDFIEIQGNYHTAAKVETFLSGLREDLNL
ncbi:MAG: hypothetical protein WC784_05780 [Candidatus Shapirobacteria bacterium]|jgi:predicted transcriptional regulator of viral defense system